ncbi:MAG: ATP-binding cassette domain-containing protein [Actinomycetota bacterium]
MTDQTRPVSSATDAPPPGEPLYQVRELTCRYRAPRVSVRRRPQPMTAIRHVDLDIHAGERFGLVGESGSGKSTLLRCLAALQQPTSGSIRFRGQELVGRRDRQLAFLRREVQFVFQDPMASLDPRMRVRQLIAEPLVAQRYAGIGARVEELLDAVGLARNAADRYPHQFSGGQRQRIAIARALALRPTVLLADEPVSALDVSVRAQILNLLAELVEAYDLTLVFVSHDLAVVRHVCDTVAVMRAGRLVESGSSQRVSTAPQHEYTRALVAAVPTLRRALAGAAPDDLLDATSASTEETT